MARGWHYDKLSLSNAPRLSFSGMCIILLFLFLSLCRFCLFVFFFCSHWSLVDVPLIFFCPADHVPDWHWVRLRPNRLMPLIRLDRVFVTT